MDSIEESQVKRLRPNITGLILAGGRSRRFGANKAMHVVGGRTMIARVHAAMAPLVREVLVSVASLEPGLSAATGFVDGTYGQIVQDHHRDGGPMAGLHAGLVSSRSRWLLVVACDMPFLTCDVLRRLCRARSETVHAVVAETADGQTHPLCALYRGDVLAFVETAFLEGRLAMHHLLAELPTNRTVRAPARVVLNVNYPHDLSTA